MCDFSSHTVLGILASIAIGALVSILLVLWIKRNFKGKDQMIGLQIIGPFLLAVALAVVMIVLAMLYRLVSGETDINFGAMFVSSIVTYVVVVYFGGSRLLSVF